ncbi:helix-turn-helix domain-containing protein [Nonomuraea sp. NN258]|uniref:PucR family transcriptional regulator n=1 Tax=Nonomuraea antri TaxID=2730852 RepID=UPI0015684C8B|nr:helix-turn-helix domain-containing protein [Nonomuraea antri]NRQ39541.1 helix-turn-helix domain-containing protein [Nonomuraea antri]
MPSIVDEVLQAIGRDIPEFANRTQGAPGRLLRRGVDCILSSFVQKVADPSASFAARDKVCRQLGRFEARQGRTLDSLQAAYRLGLRLVYRRSVEVGKRHGLDPSVVAAMGDSIITYMSDLAEQSVRGYREALARASQDMHERRVRLLRHILQGDGALAEHAARAGWSLPEEVTLVLPRAGQAQPGKALHGDMLADWEAEEPVLLLPGPIDADAEKELTAMLGGAEAVISVTVPPAQAPTALRWARGLSALAGEGAVPGGPLLRCDDHLVSLLLLADLELTDQIGRKELAPLDAFSEGRRGRLIETLGVWLATRGTAADIGERLNVHPQTVRYRMRQLENAMGEALTEPDRRFAIELVLRAREVARTYAAPP